MTLSTQDKAPAFTKFLTHFIKSLKQTTYYTGNHPAAVKAREGLFLDLKKCIGDAKEISFIKNKTMDETTILIDGIVNEPVNIKDLVSSEEAKLYLPKLLEYFERKNLYSFTLKSYVTKEEFHRFIDMMSETPLLEMHKDIDLETMARKLQEEGIYSISVLMDKESIGKGLKLPWRVEIALSRLHKDLQILPLYKDASEEKLKEIKCAVIEDILRPIAQPDTIREILCYQELITKEDPLLNDLNLDEDLYVNFPPREIIIAVSGDIPPLPPDIDKKKVVDRLKKAAQFALKHDLPDDNPTISAINKCIDKNMLSKTELSSMILKASESLKLYEEFLKKGDTLIKELAVLAEKNTDQAAIKILRLAYKIIQNESFQKLRPLIDLYFKIKNKITSENADILNEEKQLASPKNFEIIIKYITETENADKGPIIELITTVHEPFRPLIEEKILHEDNPSIVEFLCEILPSIHNIPESLYISLLKKHENSPELLKYIIRACGGYKSTTLGDHILKAVKNHSPDVRKEAIETLFKIDARKYIKTASAMLTDRSQEVMSAAVHYIGAMKYDNPHAMQRLILILLSKENTYRLRMEAADAIIKIGNIKISEKMNVEDALIKIFPQFIPQKSGWIKKKLEWDEKYAEPYFKILAKIGNVKILPKLKKALKIPHKKWQINIEKIIKEIEAKTN